MAPGKTIDTSPMLRLPGREFAPLRTLAQRFAGATFLVLLVAALAYFDRTGYTNNAGGLLSPLDAIYYATVTLTTTGYGDIYPTSPGARAVTAFVVTPLRVIFLVLLVGTTVEILTERTRQAWRINRWRATVQNHTIVCGYGAKGVGAIDALTGNGTPPGSIVVIELDPARADAASRAGHPVVRGSAAQTATLQEADIHDAAAVVVAVDRDDAAVLVVLTARELNPGVPISATVREEENTHLLRQSGAGTVVPSSGAAGRLAGIATFSPALVGVLEDLLSIGTGVDLVEHEVTGDGAGAPAGEEVILVVRGGETLLRTDPRSEPLQPGDRVIALTTGHTPHAA